MLTTERWYLDYPTMGWAPCGAMSFLDLLRREPVRERVPERLAYTVGQPAGMGAAVFVPVPVEEGPFTIVAFGVRESPAEGPHQPRELLW